ncbi:DUF6261 family protein [Sunxiuqinia indica]|uniref:DUF6261 family protein n=1 Tax=Sunxiuqinia indica TaxID=2692584 RepID=UPI00135ADBD2|nr:DUF6261 family protein [Sunxiuqinia indica]
MLIKILYSYFSLANLIVLAKRIRNLLSEKFPDHPMITSVLDNLELKLVPAIQAIGSTTKHTLTQDVSAADGLRDSSFRSLRDHVEAGLLRQNEPYRLACEALWGEFEKNGLNLYYSNYSEETAAIDSLVKDLSKPENQEHLATINALEWKDELERDNQIFVSAIRKRSAARSADDTLTDMEAFKQLQNAMELLVNVVNSLHAMNEPEGIGAAANEVKQYVSEATTWAKQSTNNTNDNDNGEVVAPS